MSKLRDARGENFEENWPCYKIILLWSSKAQNDLNLLIVKGIFGWTYFKIPISYAILHGFKDIMKALCTDGAQLLAYS